MNNKPDKEEVEKLESLYINTTNQQEKNYILNSKADKEEVTKLSNLFISAPLTKSQERKYRRKEKRKRNKKRYFSRLQASFMRAG